MSRLNERQAKVVAGLLEFTSGTQLEADTYERRLLTHYAAGRLTLTQVEQLLDRRQVLVKELRLFC